MDYSFRFFMKKQNQMKYLNLMLVLVLAMLVSGCASTKYATSEYDDVYYSKSDAAAYTAVNTTPTRSQQTTRPSVSNYNDAYYADDDFYYSRRVRRFNSPTPGNSNWRYYDPYYSNDLYYVIGTPSWNTWNNNGWYDWNRPRFGASISFGNSYGYGYNPYQGYNPWGAYNPWNAYSYSNPWTNAYYGYNPYSNYAGWGGYGYGAYGYGNAYCPPAYYGSGSGVASSSSNWRQYNEARRVSSRSLNSTVSTGGNSGNSVTRQNTGSRNSQMSNANSPDRNRQIDNNNYLTPRTPTVKPGSAGRVAPGSGTQVGNTATNPNTGRTYPTNSNSRVRPTTRTAPSSNGANRVQPNTNNTNRNYTPANPTRNNNNVSPAPTRTSPSRTNTNNINRSNGGGTFNNSSSGGSFNRSGGGSSSSPAARPSSTRSTTPTRSTGGGTIRRN